MKRFKFPKPRRILRWVVIIIVVAFVILNVILPVVFGIVATASPRASVGSVPEGFQAISLTTSDNVELAAWYAPPQNGAVIVLVHGAGDSRNSVRSYAQMLVKNGFGVLAFDLRGQGESDGQTNLYSWEGTRDVGAAISYLSEQDGVQSIGGLGLSVGGETLLGAISTYPELKAVASEGATYRSMAEFHALTDRRSFFRSISPWIMYTSVRIFSGDTPPTPILDSITGAANTRLLLMAAGNIRKEIDYNTLFAETAGERAALWIVPDVGHIGGFSRYPDEYEQRVVSFFDEALLGEQSQ